MNKKITANSTSEEITSIIEDFLNKRNFTLYAKNDESDEIKETNLNLLNQIFETYKLSNEDLLSICHIILNRCKLEIKYRNNAALQEIDNHKLRQIKIEDNIINIINKLSAYFPFSKNKKSIYLGDILKFNCLHFSYSKELERRKQIEESEEENEEESEEEQEEEDDDE